METEIGVYLTKRIKEISDAKMNVLEDLQSVTKSANQLDTNEEKKYWKRNRNITSYPVHWQSFPN